MSVIITGDDVLLCVTLKKSGATFVIDPGATVKASLISMDHRTVLVGPVTQSNAAVGADWSNSVVVIEMGSALTAGLNYSGEIKLEIQVDDDIKLTWFFTINLLQGTIA